jgi:iron complex transport system substrate-binding protein
MRVISLAPTHTESIAALGALDVLAGVSEDCDFPEDVRRLKTYGSWASPDVHAVCRDAPDLVCTFGRHQEDMASWLQTQAIPVFHSDPQTVSEALQAIALLATRLGRPHNGQRLVARLEARMRLIDRHTERIPEERRPKIFRLMQWDPLITVGPGAFQYDVIQRAGGVNFLGEGAFPYEKVSHEAVVAWDPDLVFFCEPSLETLMRRDPRWQNSSALRTGHVFLFPCGLTCRAGPRIVDMAEQLGRLVQHWVQQGA